MKQKQLDLCFLNFALVLESISDLAARQLYQKHLLLICQKDIVLVLKATNNKFLDYQKEFKK